MNVSMWLLAGNGIQPDVLCVAVSAHHSFAAEYDSSKTISIKGTVAKIAWVNPHAYIYINAKDASGKPVTWRLKPSSMLSYRRWSRLH